jgi:uncharacterized protein (DUF2252 family)
MPLETNAPDVPRAVTERRQDGHALRKLVPRSLHAGWEARAGRRDPIHIIQETGLHRIPSLLPMRYGRMRASPFAFLRGATAIMAADLAATPSSGIRVQACGDAHLSNFGTYSSPEGTPVFDVNDFDETLPAPFEWDLKRLATSFAVAAKTRGMAEKAARQLARTASMAYRIHMADLVRLGPMRAWHSRIDVVEALATIEDLRVREREERRVEAILDATTRRNWPKLIERRDGAWRIRERPPLVFPLGTRSDDTHEMAARTAFASYRATLPEERRLLLDRFRLEDVAFKVVGVGSVGTFCAVGLFANLDGDTLLLQIKEAQTSALAPYAGPSAYSNQGQRVVVGQRIMQAVTDVFLGWTQDPGDDRHCYVRHLKDSRLAMVGADIAEGALGAHALLCGRTLARAHARSGDAAQIAGYMGSGTVMDGAIAEFAMSYAEQTERDWRLFEAAIASGQIEAAST